ncbi:MAG: YraN family protein [Paracoccaceae bacterium]
MKKANEPGTGFQFGLAAEEIAAGLYERQSGRVLGRRVRNGGGEIDLIVECGGQTIFIEVKARSTLDRAAAALSRRQIERIGNAAEVWLSENGRAMQPMRFDVVLVDGSGGAEILENVLSFDDVSY